jgi:hypothetical protein
MKNKNLNKYLAYSSIVYLLCILLSLIRINYIGYYIYILVPLYIIFSLISLFSLIKRLFLVNVLYTTVSVIWFIMLLIAADFSIYTLIMLSSSLLLLGICCIISFILNKQNIILSCWALFFNILALTISIVLLFFSDYYHP